MSSYLTWLSLKNCAVTAILLHMLFLILPPYPQHIYYCKQFSFLVICGLFEIWLSNFFFFLVKFGANVYEAILLAKSENFTTKEMTHLCP